MKVNFTSEQIKWASQHDWFVIGNSEMIIGCERNEAGAATVSFNNFQALMDWAGY